MRPTNRLHLTWLAWLLVAGILALDVYLPPQFNANLLYVVVILLGLWTPSPRFGWRFAGVSTAVSMVVFLISPRPSDAISAMFNQIASLLVLWITAAAVTSYRQSEAVQMKETSARRAAEAALRDQESLAQLGKMAAVVAHEVRNPLAGIRGALQVIGRRLSEQSPERRIADEIISRIDTLNAIVQDLLQFARPRQPVIAEVSVDALAKETISLLQADPALAHLEISIDADVNLRGDREQLKLALLNLLMNSGQAMQGHGRIDVTASHAGPWVELRVVDRGPGIPPEARAHLFEPFFTTKHRGTGLGLATTRRIFEAHRGTIELQCPPAGGTVAVIRLPSTTH